MASKPQYKFYIKVVVDTDSGQLIYEYNKTSNWLEIHFTVPFSNEAEKNISEITVYNMNPTDFNRIKKGNKVSLYAGYAGDVGLLMSGTIYRTTIPYLEDADTAYVLRVLEGQDYTKMKKVNLTFGKGAYASDIIKSVASKAGINLTYISLKDNKRYDDGYTADDHPFDVLSEIADDCKTSLFYLRGQLTLRYVYDGNGADSFELGYNTGLLESPTREDRDDDWTDYDDDDGLGAFAWSANSILNYHLTTFAYVHLKTQYVNQGVMVISGEHSFDGEQPTTSIEAVQKS
ncbi:phage protein [Loigolactobacillus bifermentans]|jgi:hypothetical protein|uniref:Uncharacterized protein n=1 Tax=Loigolactobacillus bifermentans DSM 20003 TaxID=1423726 RepID=A0A0R1HCG6_9LACO|nr:hypothetical protein [Loigolactobacillus bifermentans]KRK40791.1 hypothetical protein FC07_GL002540 [Loigolactobacillus bifermentans DSM 20003]QGG59544.1 hypothetical protein LB003_03090 [Loigolactobacillus bifermentans]